MVSGLDRGAERSLLCALYLALVLVILAASGRHRLRICLRVSDQAGRIAIAMALPALVLLAWLPVPSVLRLALWSGGMVIACRVVLCTRRCARPTAAACSPSLPSSSARARSAPTSPS